MDLTELFLAFTKNFSILVTALILFWLLYGWMIYHSLKHEGKGRSYFLIPLKKQSIENFYHKKLKQLLDYTAKFFFKDHKRIKLSRVQPETQLKIAKWKFINSYTESSFLVLLWIALFYPLSFVLINWLFTSQGGEIGSFNILNDGEGIIKRTIFVGNIALLFFFKRFLLTKLMIIVYWLYIIAYTNSCFNDVGPNAYLIFSIVVVAVTANYFFDKVFVVTCVVTLVGVNALFSVRIFRGFSSVDAFYYVSTIIYVGSIAIAFSISFFVKYIYAKQKKFKSLLLFWLCFYILFICYFLVIVYWIGKQELPGNIMIGQQSPMIFLGLMPLVNAPFDWVSLGVTRSLLFSIVDKVHVGVIAFFWIVFDIVIALVLLLGIITTSTVIISLSNYLFQLGGNYGPILDLNIIISDLRENSFNSTYYWLYAMFLSTLFPTAIHLILAAWSMVIWIPTKAMKWLRKGWKEDQLKHNLPKLLLATAYYTLFLPVALVAPLLVLYGLHVVLIQYGYAAIFGESLLENMNELAHWVNPLMEKKL